MTSQFITRFYKLTVYVLLSSQTFGQVSEIQHLQPLTVHENYFRVYQNIQEEFQRRFPNADNVNWSKAEKNFLAVFNTGSNTRRALFTPKGRLVYSIVYGNEKDLPTDIRKMVKRMYVEFEITAAVKVEQDNRLIWIINLHDADYLVSVRVENGEYEEIWKYVKYQKPAKGKLVSH